MLFNLNEIKYIQLILLQILTTTFEQKYSFLPCNLIKQNVLYFVMIIMIIIVIVIHTVVNVPCPAPKFYHELKLPKSQTSS